MEKDVSLLEVDVMTSRLERDRNRRADQYGGGIGAAVVLWVVVWKGEDKNKGVLNGQGRQQQNPPSGVGGSSGVL